MLTGAALALLSAAPAGAADGSGDSPAAAASRTLVFASDDIPPGLDYDGPSASTVTSQTAFVNLMEPLLAYADQPQPQDGVVMPDFAHFTGRLAESWSFDRDSLTWTFHLRHGVRSCAGNLFTADDVIFTFQRAKSVSGAAPIGWFLATVGGIKGFDQRVLTDPQDRDLGDAVRKIDDYTVEIRQSGPNQLFLPVLTVFGLLIFDSAEVRRHATPADPWAHAYVNGVAAPGFGPYCVEHWVKNDHLDLRANPAYYRGAPAIDRVVMKKIPQSSNRFIILRMGEAQMAEHMTPREFIALAKQPGLHVSGVTGNESLILQMNFRSPPFDNIKLRQAMAYAVPYDAIIRNGFFGQAVKWNGAVPATYPGFKDNDHPYVYDPARARQLLAEAGYPDGQGLERFAGAFRLAYPTEREASLGPIASILQTHLRQIGIPIELDPIPNTQFADRQLVKKDLPLALTDQEKPVVPDAVYAVSLFFLSQAAGGVNNMSNYSNPRVDALTLAARSDPDPAHRAALIAEVQDILMQDVAWLPIVQFRTQVAMSDKVTGYAWFPENGVHFASLRVTP